MDSTMVAVTPTDLMALGYRVVQATNKYVEGGWLAIPPGDPSHVGLCGTEDEAWQWAARHRIQSEGRTEAADEIASLRARVEGLVAENESLRHECTSMWRGGVSNTVAVVDRVRNAFAKGLRLKKNARLAHFDAELDIALGDWFDLTRIAKPGTYNESENVFRRARQALKDTPDAE